MSSPLPRSELSRKGGLLRWTLVVVAALILACGLSIGFIRNSHDDKESRESAGEINQYLSLVQRRDRTGADAMLCGGDDSGPADLPVGYLEDGHAPVMESFAIVDSWDWSSVIDGHGTGYLVRMLFADGSTADVELVVEVIGDDPCIATSIPF
ncbi:hypothetical protein [Phytohabitans houttuyneae]|uniref:Uncharacterized protein n=1 Tax=Phytohabitans houttuyneae TaxID=1076126 RepID=A0A6V8K1C4_9ACTN|nr:hypothetical protein [Phytohabitans houttuyneae]GFJ77390.1 hypothetical protein Phou_015700 [Phytohabitans houttuyneae]